MNQSIKSILALLLAALVSYPLLASTQTSIENKPSLAPILKRVMPSVVNIKTIHNVESKSAKDRQAVSLASGVIVDAEKGYILTNDHVINQAQEILVTLNDGRHFFANVIGNDQATDIALLQIQADKLEPIKLGESQHLQVGDYVLAIGNPFGLTQSVTSGIISALGRSDLGIEGYEDFIQTDASINLGNSGGALIDLDGKLIGINTAIIAPDGGNVGIGFAIPVDMAISLMHQLIDFGEIRRGLLGVVAQPLNPELAQSMHLEQKSGALVAQVSNNSIAAQAGVEIGDLITKVNQKSVHSATELRNEIGLIAVGKKFHLEVLRGKRHKTLQLTMTDPAELSSPLEQVNTNLSGIELGQINRDVAGHGHINALELIALNHESPAYRRGLRQGDIITSVNQQQVHNLTDINRTASNGEPLLLHVLRGQSAFFMVLKS